MTRATPTLAANAGAKQRGRQFQPGQSGNPTGKPKGARHRTTLAVQALMEGDAEKLSRKAIDMALAGDATALRLCLDRIAPAPRDRTIAFVLPAIVKAGDAPGALAAIIAGVAEGSISPSEAASMATLVDRWRAAFETSELELRMRAIEERMPS
jgi:hypothetical protein